MLKYLVQVHPVEAGRPNLFKVKIEREFDTRKEAFFWAWDYNAEQLHLRLSNAMCLSYAISDEADQETLHAIYRGCVDTETGDLVEDAHEGLI